MNRSSWRANGCFSILVWSVIKEIPHEYRIIMGTANYLEIIKLKSEYSAIMLL